MTGPADDPGGTAPEGTTTDDPLAGAAYADFEKRGVVGAGSGATVHEATVDGDRRVALKEPHAPDAAPGLAERFREEAETWATVDDHDAVVSVHAWGTDPHPWIALEYVEGGTLADRVGTLPPERALGIGSRVAAAVEHAHSEGVVHLDLKPGNVLLADPDGGPAALKVADWGLARALRTGVVNLEGLSPRYAAPEQFAPDRYGPVGAATDVYGLGVVLYELLVGSVPFDGPPRALRDAVLDEPPSPPSGRNPDLPPAVDGLLDRALAKDPDDRYPSMAAFRRAIGDVTGDAAPGPGPDTDPDPDAAPAVGIDGGVAAPYDRALSVADEGFVRLSDRYFARRDPAPPLEAWRRGVTLADARAGRAVDRTVDDPDADREGRTPLVARLVDGLASGVDHAVLGPPGSGKSTVCKGVACTWFDRGHGPVFYRESGGSARFDRPDALARRVTEADGHALVVVEDAVRPEARAVFELRERVADRDDATLLLDARESEWTDAGRGSDGPGADAVARGRAGIEPTYVPRPDEREHERFVRAVEAATDRSVDVDVERLRADVRRAAASDDDGRRPGELFYLLHRLTALARDPLTDEAVPTTLTDAVAEVRDLLATRGEAALDVGVCANALNAAGVGVHPELLYAVVPDDPLAVDEAVGILDGRALFPREADWSGGTRAYPAVHGAWSVEFLAHCLDAGGEADAADRFGRILTRVLSLADDDAARDRVAGALDGDAPHVARIEADPTGWADETVEALYALVRDRPRLAPLFGDGGSDSVDLPRACSGEVADEWPIRLGSAFEAGGYLECAERAFERLPDGDGGRAVERLLGLARVATDRGDYDDAEEYARQCMALVGAADASAGRPDDPPTGGSHGAASDGTAGDAGDATALARARLRLGRAESETGDHEAAVADLRAALDGFEAAGDRRRTAETLRNLGTATRRRGEYDRSREYLERSLAIARDLGDRRGEADALNSLGIAARLAGRYDRAREHYRRSLELKRELGGRQGEANSLANLGVVASLRGEFERAHDYHRRALAIDRDLGDRQGEVDSLSNLGNVAYRRGEYDRAREYHERSREVARAIGDRQGEEFALNNLGIVAVKRGEYDRARREIEAGLDLAREIGHEQGVAINLGHLGAVARLRGEYDRAREYLERSLGIYRELGFRVGEAYALANLGAVAGIRGEHDRAREHLERSLGIAEEVGHPVETCKSLFYLGELARRRGEYDRAREHVDRAREVAEGDTAPFETARVGLSGGRLALARGDPDRARERAADAREAFEGMGVTHWAGRSRRLLGRAAADAGDAEAAREHWRAAVETFEDVGAPGDALATLAHLVGAAREAGDDDRADRWCRRARELVETAPEPTVDRYGDRLRRRCSGPNAG